MKYDISAFLYLNVVMVMRRRNGRGVRIQYNDEKMKELFDAVEQACEHGQKDYDRIVNPSNDDRDPVTGRRPRTVHTPERRALLRQATNELSESHTERFKLMMQGSTKKDK